jgi:hypothetical protein
LNNSREGKERIVGLKKIVLKFLQTVVSMKTPPTATIVYSSTDRITSIEANKKDLSGGEREKNNAFSRMIKTVSRKRPLNLFRRSSFQSHQACIGANEAAIDQSEEFGFVERRVKFADNSSLNYTLSLHHYTPDEILASWYHQEEYKRIAKECCKEVLKLEKGEIFKDKKYCSRGLESHTRQAITSARRNRKLAVKAVLKEQDEQHLLVGGVVDEGAISCSYQRVTSSSQLWACVVGLCDQRAAERYLE